MLYTIGQKVANARNAKGMTTKDMARKMRCKDVSFIEALESGKLDPTTEYLHDVAQALGTTVDRLLPREWLSPSPTLHMTMNGYQQAAARSINPALTKEEMLRHGLHGLAGEVGEIHSLFQKVYQGHTLDPAHLKKETGDALWMISEICTAMGWTLEDVAQTNIDKLLARFPNGFEVDKSLHRKEGDV